MAIIRYVVRFGQVLVAHGIGWWATIILTYVLGAGFFAEYPGARDQINSWQSVMSLPQEFPLWWIVIPFFLWTIISLVHAEAVRRDKSPRLHFELPFVEQNIQLYVNARIEHKGGHVETLHFLIDLLKIIVRNNPNNREEGRPVEEAYCVAEFYDEKTNKLVCKVPFCRWTENLKPRPDEMDKPKFKHPMNFIKLEPNDSPYTIDFALNDRTEPFLYGFSGASQSEVDWKHEQLRMPSGRYKVKLVINGNGLPQPVERWVIVTKNTEDGIVTVKSKE